MQELSLEYGDSQNTNLGQYRAFVLVKEQKHVQMHQSLTSETVSSISASKESTSPQMKSNTFSLQNLLSLTTICSYGTLITCLSLLFSLPTCFLPQSPSPVPFPSFFLTA